MWGHCLERQSLLMMEQEKELERMVTVSEQE